MVNSIQCKVTIGYSCSDLPFSLFSSHTLFLAFFPALFSISALSHSAPEFVLLRMKECFEFYVFFTLVFHPSQEVEASQFWAWFPLLIFFSNTRTCTERSTCVTVDEKFLTKLVIIKNILLILPSNISQVFIKLIYMLIGYLFFISLVMKHEGVCTFCMLMCPGTSSQAWLTCR